MRLVTRGVALWLLWACVAGAQEVPHNERKPTQTPARPVRPVFVQFAYTPSALFRTDFHRDDGSLAVYHDDFSVTLVFPVPGRGRLNVAASHDRYRFRFRDVEPEWAEVLEEAYSSYLTVAYMGRLTDTWSMVGVATAQATTEQGASHADGLMGMAQIGFNRAVRGNLQLGVGGFFSSRLDRNPLVFPTVRIAWDITDRWTLETRRGTHLTYRLDAAGHWQAGWNVEYASQYIRLRKDGPSHGGIWRSRGVVSTLSLRYRPNPGILLGGEIGYMPIRSLRIQGVEGNSLWQQRAPGTPVAALRASITF